MQKKRIGRRLVLLSWNRYQQLLAAERYVQREEEWHAANIEDIRRRSLALLKKYEDAKAVGQK